MPGSPSAEELSHITVPENKVVLTRSGAITVFGTEDVVGRHFKVRHETDNGENIIYDEVTVAGVVEDIRKSVPTNLHSIYFRPDTLKLSECRFVLRLREGIDAHRFLEEHGKEVVSKGKTNYNRISAFAETGGGGRPHAGGEPQPGPCPVLLREPLPCRHRYSLAPC